MAAKIMAKFFAENGILVPSVTAELPWMLHQA